MLRTTLEALAQGPLPWRKAAEVARSIRADLAAVEDALERLRARTLAVPWQVSGKTLWCLTPLGQARLKKRLVEEDVVTASGQLIREIPRWVDRVVLPDGTIDVSEDPPSVQPRLIVDQDHKPARERDILDLLPRARKPRPRTGSASEPITRATLAKILGVDVTVDRRLKPGRSA